ncbi:MAG: hypothetical protein IIW34_06025 [Clostridia bacterium]|nr:hypothetical protein [Clostridia bacterium]
MPRLPNSRNAGKKLRDAEFRWRDDFMYSKVMFEGREYVLIAFVGSGYTLTLPALCMEDIIDENEQLPLYELTWKPDPKASLEWDPVPPALYCDWKNPVGAQELEARFDLNKLQRTDFDELWKATRAGREIHE